MLKKREGEMNRSTQRANYRSRSLSPGGAMRFAYCALHGLQFGKLDGDVRKTKHVGDDI